MVNQLLDQYHADGVNQIYWVEIEFSTKMAWVLRVHSARKLYAVKLCCAPASGYLPAPMRSFDEIIEGKEGHGGQFASQMLIVPVDPR